MLSRRSLDLCDDHIHVDGDRRPSARWLQSGRSASRPVSPFLQEAFFFIRWLPQATIEEISAPMIQAWPALTLCSHHCTRRRDSNTQGSTRHRSLRHCGPRVLRADHRIPCSRRTHAHLETFQRRVYQKRCQGLPSLALIT